MVFDPRETDPAASLLGLENNNEDLDNNNESTEQTECTVYDLQLFAFSSALALQNYDPACLTVLPWLCNRMPPTLLSQLIAIKTTFGI